MIMKLLSLGIPSLIAGILYSLLLSIASILLIRNIGSLFSTWGSRFSLKNDTVQQISTALSQLKTANLSTPWLFLIITTSLLTLLFYFLLFHHCKKALIATGIILFLLFIPFVIVTFLFTTINDIKPGRVLFSYFVTEKEAAPEIDETSSVFADEGAAWRIGYGRCAIVPDETSEDPLYIAGYNQGLEISDVLDYCEARAVWLDTGDEGVLLIGIDCVALDSGTIQQIRNSLSDIANCKAIHVYSTHTHAGPDSLGLWGPIGINGKNPAYMTRLIKAAEAAGREAASNPKDGSLYYGYAVTENMYRDSRDPQVFDPNLYQLRFEPTDGSAGVRMFFYGAHAESLRGSNTLLSRDFPGVLCDQLQNSTGDNTIFFSSAAGGLIMTKDFFGHSSLAVANLELTSEKLVNYALSITPSQERQLAPSLQNVTVNFTVPLDNIVFALYKTLGILHTDAVPMKSGTGYGVHTSLSVLQLGDLAVTLIPGEPFPELIYGGSYGDTNPSATNPRPLCDIASDHGIADIITVGLANDEIGYIVPPTDFLLNEKNPYLERTMDYKGEDHYEETNSVGPACAGAMAEAFEKAMQLLQ